MPQSCMQSVPVSKEPCLEGAIWWLCSIQYLSSIAQSYPNPSYKLSASNRIRLTLKINIFDYHHADTISTDFHSEFKHAYQTSFSFSCHTRNYACL